MISVRVPRIRVLTPFFDATLSPVGLAQRVVGMAAVVELTPLMPLTIVVSVTTVPHNFMTINLIRACSIQVLPKNGVQHIPFGENTRIDILMKDDVNKRVELTGSGFQFYVDDEIEPSNFLLNSGVFTIWEP